MVNPRCRGRLKSTDPIIGERWAYGYLCRIEGKCYIILDDAEVSDGRDYDKVISGFVEVVPETVRYVYWTTIE